MNFEEHPQLNTETIDQIRSFSDDDSIIVDLFTSFIEDSENLINNIGSLVKENNNNDKLKVAVHTLKGLAGTIGASRLHEICKVLDANLKNDNGSQNEELSDQFFSCFGDLKQHIEQTYLS